MHYLLDGYNILFTCLDDSKDFSKTRASLISYLQKSFKSLKLSGLLVFDGFHRQDEESGRGYESPLEIMYSPKGQTADSFIVEQISLSKNPKDVKVVTNDAGLTRRARSLGAHVQKNHEFLKVLEKGKKKGNNEKDVAESPRAKDRLQKIFEDRYRDSR